ncbi:WD-40 repeat protein [Gloeothece citriformis PCC 7424]|uniref:WD-40 repeat protein n=1 Tax=Gloeothece citriformis (strain PCC 7424) TaxID=65393 RepID=B7KKP4_GLOC7|nr:WD40 repeat domain-containing protein [Gloeothece citriformis]ACK71013.1 WD-40 repeat protein [Gloeothece citriformis PCC 7424]
MGSNQLHWLDIAEFAFAGITLMTLLLGIAFDSLIYPIISLTITVLLNLINRLRFQYHYKKRLSGAIKQVQRQLSEEIQDLSVQVATPVAPPEPPPMSNGSAITLFQDNLMALEASFNNIIQYLNTNALRERIEHLETVYAQLKREILSNNPPREPEIQEDLLQVSPEFEEVTPTPAPIPDVNLPRLSTPFVSSNWTCIHTLTEHTDAVSSLKISVDRKIILSGSWDQTLKVWELSRGNLLSTLNAHSQGILAVVWTGYQGSNYTFASGSFDQTIKLWSLSERNNDYFNIELTEMLTAHTGSVHALASAPNYQLLVSGSYDQTLKQWDIETGEMIASSLDSLGAIYAVALDPQGQLIASAGGDGKVVLWEAGSGEKLGMLGGNVSSVESLAISPDGRILAAGCADGTIKLWQLQASIFESKKLPQPIRILSAHRGQVHALLFSEDEQLLFSSGSDGEIKIWHPGSREAITTLTLTDNSITHANGVFSLALSSDGQLLVAGGVDGTIKVWQRG